MSNNETAQFEKRALDALKRIIIGMTVNMYTAENIAFDRIRPLEKIPLDEYLDELDADDEIHGFDLGDFNGHIITDGIVQPVDYDELYFELYRNKVDLIFKKAPKDGDLSAEPDGDFDICRYKNGLYEYLKGLFDSFREIMTANNTYFKYEDAPKTATDRSAAAEFVSAIILKNLKRGDRVDNYINAIPCVSPYVLRLLDNRQGHFYLENNDIHSRDYIAALFSCFGFYSENNYMLFEQRINIWLGA